MNKIIKFDGNVQNNIIFIEYASNLVYDGYVQLLQSIIKKYYGYCKMFVENIDDNLSWEVFRTLIYPLNKN
jgi:hypothetical protein